MQIINNQIEFENINNHMSSQPELKFSYGSLTTDFKAKCPCGRVDPDYLQSKLVEIMFALQ